MTEVLPPPISTSDDHQILIRGHDMVDDVLGVASFAEAVFLTLFGRWPDPAEAAALDVALAQRTRRGPGAAATAVARLTYVAARDQCQAAIAAGVLAAARSGPGADVAGLELPPKADEVLTAIADVAALVGDLADERRQPGAIRNLVGQAKQEYDVVRESQPDPAPAPVGRRPDSQTSPTGSFVDLIFRELTELDPTATQKRVLDAALISLIDHGLLNTISIAARSAYHATGRVDGAVAVGLLGISASVVGAVQQVAELLDEIEADTRDGSDPVSATAAAVSARLDRGERIAGFGHASLTDGDPRVTRLLEIAAADGETGHHVTTLTGIGRAIEVRSGKVLHPNVTAALAAILLDIGIPGPLIRCVPVISRTVGLGAHVIEEQHRGVGDYLIGLFGTGNDSASAH